MAADGALISSPTNSFSFLRIPSHLAPNTTNLAMDSSPGSQKGRRQLADNRLPVSTFQVTDYLKKKGFTKTEAVFRQETAYLGPDGRPAQRSEDPGPKKYLKAFLLLRNWIENNLDIYKVSRFPLLVPTTADPSSLS